MNEKIGRLYHYTALALVLLWVLWLLFPLSQETDPYGAVRLIGFIFIESLFLILGLIGLIFRFDAVLKSYLAFALLITPLTHFVGMISPAPWHIIAYSLTMLIIVAYVLVPWNKIL